MSDLSVEIGCDVSVLNAYLEEVNEIASRRASLPEFLDCLVEIREGLRHGIEASTSECYLCAAGAGHALLTLKVGQPLLDRLVALRTLDRNCDLAG